MAFVVGTKKVTVAAFFDFMAQYLVLLFDTSTVQSISDSTYDRSFSTHIFKINFKINESLCLPREESHLGIVDGPRTVSKKELH